jgi:hypothetical protein
LLENSSIAERRERERERTPIVVRSLLTLKRGLHFKHVKVMKRKLWSWVPTGLEDKNYCADEDQQQFNQPTDRSSSRATVEF